MDKIGKLFVVGSGPGDISLTAPRAVEAIRISDFVCGYEPYVVQVAKLINEKSEIFTNSMKGEIERVKRAVKECEAGKTVSLVCGGDASLSLVYELSEDSDRIEVIPGITSALSASAKLGAPVSADLVMISMSDLLTPWEIIRKRIEAVNIGDFVCAVYNPKSRKRTEQLPYAVKEFINARGDLPCGWVKNCDREGEEICVTTLSKLDFEAVDMRTILIVGNSKTMIKNGKLVSPRGYTDKYGV